MGTFENVLTLKYHADNAFAFVTVFRLAIHYKASRYSQE